MYYRLSHTPLLELKYTVILTWNWFQIKQFFVLAHVTLVSSRRYKMKEVMLFWKTTTSVTLHLRPGTTRWETLRLRIFSALVLPIHSGFVSLFLFRILSSEWLGTLRFLLSCDACLFSMAAVVSWKLKQSYRN